jgi:diaminohydroxyphosphoribosylaminopyrimidine deaminase/5-amino-6-(5-phosphoribosylamino)uracil reductase
MAGSKTVDDTELMRSALRLAARGLGATMPNPTVGCVLYRPDLGSGGRVVGRGWTQPGGRPHAETEALLRAGDRARGATAYVTLEPCAHQGRTAPCVSALVEAGVERVVIAILDPDPRVNGAGVRMLEDAGVDVLSGVCGNPGAALLAGYLMRLGAGRPMVTVKVATSLDGKIALHDGQSKWITGDLARARAHLLRARHDGVMVGVGTLVQDDPELTCRLPGLEARSPVRIIADGSLRSPLTSRLIATANQVPTWIIAADSAQEDRKKAFADLGVQVLDVGRDETGNPDMMEALSKMADLGLQSLLVEGGGRLVSSLLLAGFVDRIVWFRAPKVIGDDGVAAAAALGLHDLEAAPRFHRVAVEEVGDDILETYEIRD